MNNKEITGLKEILSTPKKIVIVSHRNPDGDAYGSSLALNHYLVKLKHNVTIVSPNDCPDFLKWLPGQDKIVVFEEEIISGTALLNEAELIFTLDFNALHRVGNIMFPVLEKATADFIMIDHHQTPDDYAKYMFSDPTVASTSEMVYEFISMLGDIDKIDVDIASCLYTGIVTDTGSFKYPSTKSSTHDIISNLMKIGIDHTRIHTNLYDTNSLNRLQLLGKALKNLRVIEKYKTAYITLSQRELNSFNFKKGDTEGFVNYGLSLEGITFAAIFIEDQKQGIVKISFRSKGTFSVNEFARKYFDGGGHVNAAGGKSELNMDNTVAKFLKALPDYKTELVESYEK